MKKIIKKIIPKFIKKKCRYIITRYVKQNTNVSKKDKLKYLIFNYHKYKLYKSEKNLLNNIKIDIDNNSIFVYGIDYYKTLDFNNNVIENNSIDYYTVLNNSLADFKNKTNNSDMMDFINSLNDYIDRIIKKLNISDNKNKKNIIKYFENIKTNRCECFEEALQRILFYNQLLWQFGHGLIGLGRLDKILEEYYQNDINKGILTKEKAKELLTEFCVVLNKDFVFKSSSLIGDTGQLIIIGGKEKDNSYFYNDLTLLFIDIIEEIKKPDPKLLLRVSYNIPIDIINRALKCICTGVGSPLLSNDEQIINKLIEFGYDENDAYNYSASACWEPLIAGKSLDPNNINCIDFLKPFNDMLDSENISKYNYSEIESKYFEYLSNYLDEVVIKTNEIKFEKSNILSLLVDNCLKNNKNIADGGAKYNNYGFTSVGMSNVVNSLLNLKKYVFDEKMLTYDELNNARLNNYNNNNKILNLLKSNEFKFGLDDEQVISLTNLITSKASEILSRKNNNFGGKFKFGLSSPGYIIMAKNNKASFDGRKDYEPYPVHISSMNNSYIELIQFACKLDYSANRFNGNVIDFFVAPLFIEKNFDKFSNFIFNSIKNGFFQMQMNIVSSDILIKAKNNPKLFPNLIVRVWGFSTYFNDLPEEYKDLLIERAISCERR